MDSVPFSSRKRVSTGLRLAGPHKTLRLLVVDDEAAIREILALLLSEAGHEVTTACDGLDALEKFDAGKLDVVITDRAMPFLAGDELAGKVKAIAPNMPVIMITGLVGPMDPVGPFARSIDRIIKKPFTLAVLWTAIEEVMAEKAAST